ncbi:hypothetical protein BEL04_15880 [Mucilaginibacter sp. PPCGB 2223]|uniref:hypothetical protein n=1 Tax=Mucilaginibacter sp. PPCGB 2223 TaxID=1886027 RepID=UPI000826C3A0|nr:hypothetical protein [Mucilaginibacter sp. PPCGB 2223]OCX51503.1 hypothetical protein BEL04_15880 [Mucilaginibacter sp. PPCGB 2223]
MNLHSDNELDFLFKNKLTTEDNGQLFEEEEWENMESILLHKPRKKAGIIWLYQISGGMAASLLVCLGLYFVLHSPGKAPVNGGHKIAYAPASIRKGQHIKNQGQNMIGSHQIIASDAAAEPPHHHTRVPKALHNTAYADSGSRPADAAQTLSLAAADTKPHFDEGLNNLLINASASIDPANRGTADHKNAVKASASADDRFALAVMAAPDLNGVNSFSNERTGIDLAIQFSLKLTSKLSISTGASYAIKPYQTSIRNYRTNSPGWSSALWTSNAKPNTVNADCYVLDIPLNINYQVYNRGNSSFTVGTGLSSYLMLKEDYRFDFPDPAKSAVDLDINNQNRHILGVWDLDINYRHRLNNKLGLLVQPYLKLPITRIGFGQVDLQSAGVAVGFDWNVR